MSRRARFSKYSRRTSSSGSRRGLKVLIITAAVVAFLLLSLTLSVALGIALGNRAEEYENSLPVLDLSVKEHYSGDKSVKAVRAQAHQWGYGVDYYVSVGVTDFSVCLRDADGFISYRSEVDVSFGEETDMGSRRLSDAVGQIRDGGGFVCGYFYSTAFSVEDEYLRNVRKAYELALIREAAEGGVDDLLVVGLDPSSCDLDELEEFVCSAAIAAGDATLGVLLDADFIKTADSGDYSFARISASCDYIALDMRDMPSDADHSAGEEPSLLQRRLEELRYYIKAYSLRLVFSEENSRLSRSAEKHGVTCFQVID